jgi:hypothetical protein
MFSFVSKEMAIMDFLAPLVRGFSQLLKPNFLTQNE